MPTAGKVFVHREPMPFEKMKGILEGYSVSEYYEEGALKINLVADINDVEIGITDPVLRGIYSYDGVVHNYYRGRIVPAPITTEAPFLFTEHEDKVYLIVMAKKVVANNVANRLSLILHNELGAITDPVIRPDAIKGFYEKADGTKILLFDNILIPNMNKLTLYGLNVVQTSLYGEFIGEGDPWYVVAKTKKRGWTVGLVRDGSVTIFNSVNPDGFIEYVKEEILPLILRR